MGRDNSENVERDDVSVLGFTGSPTFLARDSLSQYKAVGRNTGTFAWFELCTLIELRTPNHHRLPTTQHFSLVVRPSSHPFCS